MSQVVKTETRTYTTTENGETTTVTETIETTASGQVRKSTKKVTETYKTVSSQNKMDCALKPSVSPIRTSSPSRGSTAGALSNKDCASVSKPGNFAEDALKRHNHYRQLHGVPPLKLSSKMCAYSQEWANHLASSNTFQHRSDHKYGENIFAMSTSNPNHQLDGKAAVDSWYSEIKDHTFGQEPRSMGTGHFTQVVWKASKELGIALAKGSGGRHYVVGNYDPPGNFIGKYTDNVPPPK